MNSLLNIVTLGVIVYLIWAFIHHKRDKTLAWPILLEYFLTAVLVLIIILGILV